MADDSQAVNPGERSDSRNSTETREGPATAQFPKQIGPFHVKGILASGGMGIIYRAVQEHPRRTVAVKVMKEGIASRTAMKRFEYESQVLARLRHPGIAQIYEAGTHHDGTHALPYFAMEYIPNAKSLIEYANEKNLTTRQRLELFTHVCDAVHHGHQKGIIHRDLKPGNILVDPQGQVKIIDFGVARGTDSDLAVTTLQTDLGQLVGTLQYMSPEQCQADPDDIDTRSDVYALGVVLYELMARRLPYTISSKNVLEGSRVIREQRPTSFTAIDRTLGSDIETIVFKAMEKERDRRFRSAAELGDDIKRFLHGEGITARPPSIAYQLRVFSRRHKALFSAAAVVFVVLTVGVITSTSLYLRAESARVEAQEQAQKAQAAVQKELAARQEAEKQSEKAQAALNFLQEMMGLVNPSQVGPEIKTSDMLDWYGATLDKAFSGQPGGEAAVRTKLGNFYKTLNLLEHRGKSENCQTAARHHLEAALELYVRTLGEQHPDTLAAMSDLASLHKEHGRPDEAESLYRRGLEISRRAHGEEAPETLSLNVDLAECLLDQGNPIEAEILARKTMEARRRLLGEEAEETLGSKFQVAWLLQEQGNFSEAEPLFRTVWEASRRTRGDRDGLTVKTMATVAGVLLAQGKLAEAERLYGDKKVPEDLGIKQWFQGATDTYWGRVTLLVFCEEWCPYCQRRVPPLEKLYSKYKDRDFQVIGLTQINQSATEEKMRDFIRYNNLSFPIAKEDGTASSFYRIGGYPFVAVVKGGKLVWRGHPNILTERMLEGLLR